MVSLQIAHKSKRYCESCIFRNINKVIERLNFNISNFIRLPSSADAYKIPAQQQAGCVGGNFVTMQKIHYYFFCLYNLFYKDGWGLQDPTNRRTLPLEQRPILALCLSTWFWTLFARLIIIGLFRPAYTILPIKHYELLIPFLGFAIYYFYFIDNNRYVDIYNQYKLTDKNIRKQDSRKVIIALALPIPLFILSGLIMTYLLNINLHTFIK
jgi:hypothetical protein